MFKRIGVVVAAFLITFTTVWFPISTVYAEITETEMVETSDKTAVMDIGDDLFDNNQDETEAETPIAEETKTEFPIANEETETENYTSSGEEYESLERHDGYIHTFDDFKKWIYENDGGEVYLGANITIPVGEQVFLRGSTNPYEGINYVNIHTGNFGVIVAGNLEIAPYVTIKGVGNSQPVVEVLGGGRLYINDSGFEDAPYIEATGNGGRGLVLRESGKYDQSLSSFMRISANGTDGIAIESETALKLVHHIIEAQNGIGILCDNEVTMYLCQISAGTASLAAPNFTVDTCLLSPAAPTNGTVINRKITKLSPGQYNIPLGDPVPDYLTEPTLALATLSADGFDDTIENIYILLELSDIDTSITGTFPLKIQLIDGWLLPFDLMPEDAELYNIEVCDISIPFYTGMDLMWGMFYFVDYWYGGEDLSALTLWRSDDDGASWYDFTTEADIELYDRVLRIRFSEKPDNPSCFVWGAEGIGESQVLRVDWETVTGMTGGDRTGGDRGENKFPPITMPGGGTNPPPPTTPDNETPNPPPTTTPDFGTSTTKPNNDNQNISPAIKSGGKKQNISTPTKSDNEKQNISSSAKPDDEKQNTSSSAKPDDENQDTPSTTKVVDEVQNTMFTTESGNIIYESNNESVPSTDSPLSAITESAQPVQTTNAPVHFTTKPSRNDEEKNIPAIANINNTTQTPETSTQNAGPTPKTPEAEPPQEETNNEMPKPYSDSITPVVIVGSLSLACVGAYLGFTRRKGAKRS